MKHIKKANKVLGCNNCSGSIWPEDYYFTRYYSGGRYMWEKIAYYIHIHCVTKKDICCGTGAMELKQFKKET